MRQEGAGFQLDTNKVSLFFEDGRTEDSEILPKQQIAEMILEGVKKIPVKI